MLRMILALAALVLKTPAARASDACPLHLLADLPVRYDRNTNNPVVDAMINGQTVALGLQIESPVSALTAATVRRLALPTHPAINSNARVYIDGKEVHQVAAASIQLQHARIDERNLPVAPPDAAWAGQTGGVIGLEMLRPFDIELDLPQRRFRIFAGDHCPNHVAYWPGEAEELPLRPDVFRRLIFATRLNGQAMQTMLATAEQISRLQRPTARSRLNLPLERSLTGCKPSPARGLTVLEIGDMEIGNPRIDVDCEKPALVQVTDVRPDLILGLNHLKQLRVYIDFADKKLFFIDPAAPPPPASKP